MMLFKFDDIENSPVNSPTNTPSNSPPRAGGKNFSPEKAWQLWELHLRGLDLLGISLLLNDDLLFKKMKSFAATPFISEAMEKKCSQALVRTVFFEKAVEEFKDFLRNLAIPPSATRQSFDKLFRRFLHDKVTCRGVQASPGIIDNGLRPKAWQAFEKEFGNISPLALAEQVGCNLKM